MNKYRLLTWGIVVYALAVSGAFHGIHIPELRLLSCAGLFVGWVWWNRARTSHNWITHTTPLDRLFMVGWVVICLGALLHPQLIHRSHIGIWFTGLYVAMWFIMIHVFGNRPNIHKWVKESLLVYGAAVVIFGIGQVVFTLLQGHLVRPSSILGNPNLLGTYLIILIPLVMQQTQQARTTNKRYWFAYLIAIIFLLLLSFSRGAWIGAAIAMTSYGILVIINMPTRLQILHKQWKQRSTYVRGIMVLIVIGVVGVLCIVLLSSFSIGGRGSELRTTIWQSAIRQFQERSISGQGIYTFGYGLPIEASTPPQQTQSHAHNLPLQIAAETGLLGILTTLLILAALVHSGCKQWQNTPPPNRLTVIASTSALIGISVHHLFDTTLMMPTLVMVLFILLLDIVPIGQSKFFVTTRNQGINLGLVVLLAFGLFASLTYQQYINTMRFAYETERFGEAAQALEPLVYRYPAMPIYRQQQALLYALDQNYPFAIEAYETFLQIEPNHSMTWANLAIVYANHGQLDAAESAMQIAVKLSPNNPEFQQWLDAVNEQTVTFPILTDFPRHRNFARAEFLNDVLDIAWVPAITSTMSIFED